MEGKLKESITVFVDFQKKFKPNIMFEDIQIVFHPLNNMYEIVVLLWKNKRNYTESLKERSFIFTTDDKQEAERTLKILKNMYYGRKVD